MKQITNYINALTPDGKPNQPGYCFRNYYVYNKQNVRCRESRLKEWEFYQFIKDNYVMQLTIGHASLFDSFSFNFFDTDTGNKWEFGKLKLHFKGQFVYPNPELSHNLCYKTSNYEISFVNDNGNRTLHFACKSRKYGNVRADFNITNTVDNDKMVILTPFDGNEHQFYLNYKENYHNVTAQVVIGNQTYTFDKLVGLVDSGRGYWPFKQDWVWSSLTTKIDGKNFGWNLGWGFGNLTNATENMLFVNNKGVQLGQLNVQIDYENQPTSLVKITDKNGILDVTLTPYYDNYTTTDFVYIHNSCHQVFYKANGTATVEGTTYKIDNVRCFLEHAHNQW